MSRRAVRLIRAIFKARQAILGAVTRPWMPDVVFRALLPATAEGQA